MAEENLEQLQRADSLIADGEARLAELQAAIRQARSKGVSTLQAVTISADLRAALSELRARREELEMTVRPSTTSY